MTEERIDEEEIDLTQQYRDAMKRQVHNIIVSTLEASEAMVEEIDPASDPEELRIELIAAALNAAAAMGDGTKEHFVQMAKKTAQKHFSQPQTPPPNRPPPAPPPHTAPH